GGGGGGGVEGGVGRAGGPDGGGGGRAPAEGTHGDAVTRRPVGGGEAEGGAARVDHEEEGEGGEPGRERRRGARTGRPSLVHDRQRAHHRRQGVLLVVHAREAAVEPRPLHPTRLRIARRSSGRDLAGGNHAGGACGPIGHGGRG